jgi:hypothetical protein
MNEKKIQNDIKKLSCGNVRLFRNNVGLGYVGKAVKKTVDLIVLKNYRLVKYGLCRGSSDLIGWRSFTITKEMVGRKIAQFVGIEVKGPRGKVTKEQKNFSRIIERFGGVGIITNNVEDAEKKIKNLEWGRHADVDD